MLSFSDKRWEHLEGGYRAPFDPRPALSKLESNIQQQEAWQELWENLHHQGDVGDASFAAVPHLVCLSTKHGNGNWSTYALVATIELARGDGSNPDVPHWLRQDYLQAIQDLAKLGASQILQAKSHEDIRTILSILALSKGARTHARFLLDYSDEELRDIERQFEQPDS
jgi:hypothetical protein